VSEAGDRLGFLCESFDERRVVGVIGRQNLDRDVTVQIGVERPEYGGHPARPFCSTTRYLPRMLPGGNETKSEVLRLKPTRLYLDEEVSEIANRHEADWVVGVLIQL